MKVFQILHDHCHWQTPFSSLAETVGKFPPDCLFVEAPDYVNEQWGFDETQIGDDRFIKPEAPEGWVYDDESGQFYPEDMLEQRLSEAQTSKQNENNELFAKFLSEHPITWTDGKLYGVTLADQSEIALNMQSYEIECAAIKAAADEAGVEPDYSTATLEWHAVHEACVPWSKEELAALALTIRNFVYPWYSLNQSYKEQIYACTEVKQVNAINLEYKTEEEKAAEAADETSSNTDEDEEVVDETISVDSEPENLQSTESDA